MDQCQDHGPIDLLPELPAGVTRKSRSGALGEVFALKEGKVLMPLCHIAQLIAQRLQIGLRSLGITHLLAVAHPFQQGSFHHSLVPKEVGALSFFPKITSLFVDVAGAICLLRDEPIQVLLGQVPEAACTCLPASCGLHEGQCT
eukprot:Skav215051  [mRNA]  locus=scaffold1021:76942:85840:- [translate_table: standard]